jgi:hypothetical protein
VTIRLAAVAAAAVLLIPSFEARPGSLVVRRSGDGALSPVAESLSAEVRRKVGAAGLVVVELTGDPIADGAMLTRQSRNATVVYAVGADATALAADLSGVSVIALGIANPAKVATSATYLSVYPRLERVFSFLQEKLGARRVGFLFTPAQNSEMALAFAKAAQAKNVGFEALGVSSPGELARTIKDALPRIDVLLLAVDPLLFDRRSLDAIVEQSMAQKKPAVGFLSELAALGVAICLSTAPAEVAAKAVELSEFTGVKGKKRVEIDSAVIILSKKAVEPLKLDRARLGATDVR